jgi:DNA-binding CsgD family transcriptional regulator
VLRRLAYIAQPFAEAHAASDVVEALSAVSSPVVSLWAIGRWPQGREEPGPTRDGSRILFHPSVKRDFHADWQNERRRHGRALVTRYAASNPPPFTFAEARRRLQPSGDDHWIFDLFHDHGAKDALYCPHWPYLVVYVSDQLLTPATLPHETRIALDAGGAMAVHRLKEIALNEKADGAPPELSARQMTVLLHLSDGLTVPEIAARLNVSEASVKTFIRRVAQKLGAKSQLHAVVTALRQRLI